LKQLLPKEGISQAIGGINNDWTLRELYLSNPNVPSEKIRRDNCMKQVFREQKLPVNLLEALLPVFALMI
jgi:hypothetical protein